MSLGGRRKSLVGMPEEEEEGSGTSMPACEGRSLRLVVGGRKGACLPR